jgi:hypothetical protein
VDIGIFTSSRTNRQGVPISFFGCDDEKLLAALYKAAAAITGPGLEAFDPEPGMRVRKVGEVSVLAIEDKSTYVVEADAAAKPAGGRVPPGANGTWAIQSLIFSKDSFTLAEARKWVKEHAGFADLGADETSTSFRFRQYDPEFFSEYRTISIDSGISAAYGKIDKDTSRTEDDAKKSLSESVARWEAVHNVNKGIMAKGLRVLRQTAVIRKAEDDTEERFVLSLVLEPTDGQNGAPLKPDTQGDIYSEEDVRKAAHAWMEFHGALDLNHSWKDLGKERVRTLESYVTPVAFKIGEGKDAYDVAKGTWMLGVRIVDDALWKGVKSGEIGAYSIGGTAVRTPVE